MTGVISQEEVSDRELVTRLQAGDEQAFNDLVRRHQRRAFNVAYQLLRDHEDAMEVAQDAFVRVYRGIGTFRGDCAFTTWLHGIVVNLARNKHRWWKRRGRAETVSLDAPRTTPEGERPREQAAPGEGPDAATVQAELVDRIGRAMKRLPHKFREVLVLRNVDDLSYEEIAAALRCSVGTVKSRIARARDALREKLSAEG